MHVSSVSPPCLFSLIAFEIQCIGKVMLVVGSRLKNEVYIHVSLHLSSVFIFTACYMFVATKMQAVTITIMRCNFWMESTIC